MRKLQINSQKFKYISLELKFNINILKFIILFKSYLIIKN